MQQRRGREYHWLLKIAIILIGVCGLGICVCLYPYIAVVFGKNIEERIAIETVIWAEIIFYWVVSVPCFAVLGLFWRVSDLVKEGKLFSVAAAKFILFAAVILAVDLAVFLLGNVIFYILKMPVPTMIFILILLCGVIVALFLFILSQFLQEAAILQEESDATI